MASADDSSLATTLYRIALIAFPRPLRLAYGDEMVAAFTAAHAQRQRLGAGPARRFAFRAWFDALRAGLGSRLGRSGVSAPPPAGVAGLLARGIDRFRLEIGTDLRGALRSLASTPTFTIAAILVLALGVGVNGALFSALRAALLAPAPYPESDRLVLLDLTEVPIDGSAEPRSVIWSYPRYEFAVDNPDLAADPVAVYAVRELSLVGAGDPVRLQVEIGSPSYLDVLRVPPARGAGFSVGHSERQLMLSWGLWRDRFGQDEGVIGRELTLADASVTVVGVMPAGFRGLSGRSQAWITTDSVPTMISPRIMQAPNWHWLQAIGRLRPGATVEQLQAQMSAAGEAMGDTFEWLDPDSRAGATATPLNDARANERAQQAVMVVSGAAAMVLILACANLAILVLARGRDRQREIAVRLALGGARSRVARGLIVEMTVLALAAGAMGLLVANGSLRMLAAAWPESFVEGQWNVHFVDGSNLALDLTTAAFTVGLALLAGLLFAIGPALRLTRADLGAAMRSGAGATHAGAGARRLLVALEVAVALVLAVGAGLMISSLGRLVSIDDGIDASGLVTFAYSLPRPAPGSADAIDKATEAIQTGAFHDQFLERLRALPGVEKATLDCSPPRMHHCWITGVPRAGDREFLEGQRPAIGVHMVDEHHFDTLGTRLLRGRNFTATEDATSAPVVVINEFAARELFPGEDAIGKLLFGGTEVMSTDGPGAEIVGVVENVLYDPPFQGMMGEAYLLHRQEPGPEAAIILRVAGEPLAVIPSVRAELAAMNPNVPIYAVATVSDLSAEQVADTSAVMTLLAVFAGLAVLLAATGVWGVVAHAVTGRARELGIRLALGAAPRQVVAVTLRQGALAALAGGAAGTVGAYALSRVLASMLYEVSPTDPRTFVIAAALLVVISLLAAWFPARRASRLDPVRTLRAE